MARPQRASILSVEDTLYMRAVAVCAFAEQGIYELKPAEWLVLHIAIYSNLAGYPVPLAVHEAACGAIEACKGRRRVKVKREARRGQTRRGQTRGRSRRRIA